jgi:hypothetical protein
VVTEGRFTEKEYLNGLLRELRATAVRVVIHPSSGLDPKRIVETIKKESEHGDFDEAWGVFDVDQHPRLNDALQMARDNRIKVALSNPCFELWLYLHLADPPGMIHRHHLQAKLRELVPGDDKHVTFAIYQTNIDTAVGRAKRLDDQANAMNEPSRNPTTGVWRLVERIREAVPETAPRNA